MKQWIGDFNYTGQCSMKIAYNANYGVILFMIYNDSVNILLSVEHIVCMEHASTIILYPSSIPSISTYCPFENSYVSLSLT